MDKYTITGMSCAACQARIEKSVSGVPGVTECSVSLLTNEMGVKGTASPAEIIKAVEKAGYGACPVGSTPTSHGSGNISSSADPARSDPDATGDGSGRVLSGTGEIAVLARRLLTSVPLLLILMYFSMGHAMWRFPAPAIFDNPVFLGIFEMLMAGIIMFINSAFFISGFSSLFRGGPNMNTLVALGSSVAFLYSLAELFIMTDAAWTGDRSRAHELAHDLYFESAAMIVTLITVGKLLEAISKGRTTDALKGLMKLTPRTATVIRDGSEITVNAAEVRVDDIFTVRPGESIPVDGVIIEGSTGINESALTGESIPAEKEEGSNVYAATINLNGFIKCRALKVGEDTTLANIIRIMSDAAATKAPLARIADRVSAVFVPSVMGIAALTFILWIILGKDIGFAIARAITVLVISCPCALGLATPVAIMVGSGVGAKNGILYKTASSLEALGRTGNVILDKTGTITTGHPEVTDLIPENGYSEEDLLRTAAALESASEHPLGEAVTEYSKVKGIAPGTVADFEAIPGKGLKGRVNGAEGFTFGGNVKYIRDLAGSEQSGPHHNDRVHSILSDDHMHLLRDLALHGKTPLLFADEKGLIGVIAVRDTMKEDSLTAIRELKDMGIDVCMLTGDNEHTARAIARKAGIDSVIAGVLPTEKKAAVDRMKGSGRTAMVGDGINDAPALAAADTGIAIGAGADIALDAADIVLVRSRLTDVSAAIRLSRATIRNIHENLFWAFFYNVICIPLAAGVYGFTMKPMYGALAMSLSSFCVCMNALRLNLFKLHDASKDRPVRRLRSRKAAPDPAAADIQNTTEPGDPGYLSTKTDNQERNDDKMTKTMNIEGMMCEHCEARVKKTLLAIEGVSEAVVSHEKGTAVLTLDKDVADEVLKQAVEAQDYKVTGIE